MATITAAITGVAAYTPEYILTNQELERMVDTNDEWIRTRTGIRERRILKTEGLGASYLGAQAVRQLLEKTQTPPEAIELLICATATPDMIFPATANLICHEAGLTNAFSFDLMAACSGFLFSLTTAAHYIQSGRYKKVIVVGADKMSSIVDYTDRNTCVLFGDGAGAVLLEPSEENYGLLDHVHYTNGAGWVHLHMKAGGSRRPASCETVQAREHYIYQEGANVFKHAVVGMAEAAYQILERNQLTADDVAWLVPHQANKRIIDATAQRMGLDESKVMLNIDRYGNTTNATIPLCLRDYEHQLKKGDLLVMAAFGGGFTWGASLVRWAYNPS